MMIYHLLAVRPNEPSGFRGRNHISPHCDLDLEDRIAFFFFFFFWHDILAHGGASHYQVWLQKVAYKHSADWEQICVMNVTSLTPENTTVLSLL